MSSNDEVKTNRPDNTPFKQQQLRAWQPILTPVWVIGTFAVVGIVFIPIGIYLDVQSGKVFEASRLYDSYNLDFLTNPSLRGCHINENNQGYNQTKHGNRPVCDIELTITQDIDDDDTLYLYYQLDNFYQNHRRYVKSRDDNQLRNEIFLPRGVLSDSTLETSCDPVDSFRNPDTGLIFYPCGLIATSYFNDGIQLKSYVSATETYTYVNGEARSTNNATAPILKETGIAWSSDLSKKFMNPVSGDTGNAFQFNQYQYLWQTYDQMNCYKKSDDSITTCTPWTGTDSKGNNFTYPGCMECASDAYKVFEGGIPQPTDYSTETSQEGVRNEHFIVWMRTAGLPTFRKLFAEIEPPGDGFKKGDVITFSVIPNFEVASFEGEKTIVIGTTSALGGKNNVLGVAYIVVGSICLVLSLVFFVKHKVNPRVLGDTKYLVWKTHTS